MKRPLPLTLRHNLMLGALLAGAALAAAWLRAAPAQHRATAPALEQIVPSRFAGWQVDSAATLAPIQPAQADAAEGTYAKTLERVYRGPDDARIMLSIAYGSRQQGDHLQAHRPEYCYQAQGFRIDESSDTRLATAHGELPLRRLDARRPGRQEPVSYWLTVGSEAALPGISRKLAQLRQILSGEVPDGVLVRVSSIDASPREAYPIHDRFISDLLAALPEHDRRRLAGRPQT